jgi:hypothetical protein
MRGTAWNTAPGWCQQNRRQANLPLLRFKLLDAERLLG